MKDFKLWVKFNFFCSSIKTEYIEHEPMGGNSFQDNGLCSDSNGEIPVFVWVY